MIDFLDSSRLSTSPFFKVFYFKKILYFKNLFGKIEKKW